MTLDECVFLFFTVQMLRSPQMLVSPSMGVAGRHFSTRDAQAGNYHTKRPITQLLFFTRNPVVKILVVPSVFFHLLANDNLNCAFYFE